MERRKILSNPFRQFGKPSGRRTCRRLVAICGLLFVSILSFRGVLLQEKTNFKNNEQSKESLVLESAESEHRISRYLTQTKEKVQPELKVVGENSAADVTRPWVLKVKRMDIDGIEKKEDVPIELLNTNEEKLKNEKAVSSGESTGQEPLKKAQVRPLLILITPTYTRPAQAIHFAHLNSILRLIPPPIYWIVVESYEKTEETKALLERTAGKCLEVGTQPECTRLNYTHISSEVKHENHAQSRGVKQRNKALEFIEERRIEGIVYFMDDDNTYTPELFIEMRKVRRVGVWPVGFLWSSEYQRITHRAFLPYVERPLVKKVNSTSVTIGWETFDWAAGGGERQRKFHTDMAGFAFRSELLWQPTSLLTGRPIHPVRFRSRPMYIETMFLNRLVKSVQELEPLANDCQEVNVWHKKLETEYTDPYPRDWRLPQPPNLTLDANGDHKARYTINKQRYYIKGRDDGQLAFGYKRMEVVQEEKGAKGAKGAKGDKGKGNDRKKAEKSSS